MFRSAGKPLDYLPSPADIIRFLGKVEVIDLPGTKLHQCWRWTGAKQKGYEYGIFKMKGVCHRSNRVSFQLFVGPLDPGEDAGHLCRNQWCINPRHLEAQTRSENVADGNANRDLIAILFLGGPMDSEEKYFYPGRFPQRYDVRGYGRDDWYLFDEDLREYVHAGHRRVKKRTEDKAKQRGRIKAR